MYGALGGPSTSADWSLPGFESAQGAELLEDNFGGAGAGFGGTIVFQADQGVDDPEVRQTMERFFAEVADVEGVARVGSPYGDSPEAARQIAFEGDYANQIAFATVDLDPDLDEAEFTETGEEVNKLYKDFLDEEQLDGLQVELGGAVLGEFEEPTSELLGLAFAIFILIVAFGSVLAMGVPIGTAIAGIASGGIIAGFLSFIFHPPSFASIFGIMIGLGVGIDYALFIVTRYRENLHRGHSIRESIAIAVDTAGRAVIFAGTTVVISIIGMIVMRLSFVTGLAVGVSTVVALTMLASVTLVPALLGFAGTNIEVTRRRGLVASAFVALGLIGAGVGVDALGFGPMIAILLVLPGLIAAVLRKFGVGAADTIEKLPIPPLMKTVERREQKDLRQTLAYRWSRVIQHRPWTSALVSGLALVVLALPIFAMRLGMSDEGNYAEDTTTRQAYDLLSEGFGPGYNGPLMLVSLAPEGLDQATVDEVTAAVEADDGVASVASFPSEDGAALAWNVIPTTAPQDEATTDLVNRLRDDVLPPVTEGTGLDVKVSGGVAVNVDFTRYLADRMPYFLGAVLVLSFLLLMTVFRSVLVPLKAVIMNLLSIGAAYGVIVAGFQWGWLGGILNFESAPIEPWIPMMMFAIVFGLSMDYEVFLMSRIREEWHRTGDSRTSVADGLAATARVISAAALIMVFVFGAFLFEPDRIVKLMGVGLATAVLLDATVVRMLLVPATMELLGDRNWWLPKWLDRLLPNIDVEGHAEPGEGDDDATPTVERERQLEPTA
ncbi:MAG TPA: MMPL family transporter [Acidimicrobiales bacterium]